MYVAHNIPSMRAPLHRTGPGNRNQTLPWLPGTLHATGLHDVKDKRKLTLEDFRRACLF